MAKAKLKEFPGANGEDLKVGTEVYQPEGDVQGTVAYRVRHGKDPFQPRIGVAMDGAQVNGRKVRNVCVDASSLVAGTRPAEKSTTRSKKAA